MRVLVTGAYGTCGTAIIDHLHDREEYEFTYYNRSDRPSDHPYGEYDTVVGDINDYETLRDAIEGHDAIVHLAAYPLTDGTWEDVLEPNVIGAYTTLQAAREAEVDSFIFASTNHVVGMYEREGAPEIYEEKSGIVVDKHSPIRPDSFYGASKAFGEFFGRFYVENFEYPKRFYSLRICNVASDDHETPTEYATHLAENGIDPESETFERKLNRKKAMWQSRRDFAHLVECCLRDQTVEFDIFYGVSDNSNRWFDIENGRSVIGYRPQDRAEDYSV